ncbi:acyltransferase [Ruminococcus sp. AF17-22AC]|nr:acyltransferase [Ruminococcus sp. AF17-22AC]
MCILLCHLVVENSNVYVQMTAQLFNIGVNIFIIISGICFGLQGAIKNTTKWYKKRSCRIYIPYETFLIFLAVVYLITGRHLQFGNWISCVIGVQGAQVGVLGADHTWFLTALLICYLITPILSKIFCNVKIRNEWKLLVLIISLFLPILLAYIPWVTCHTIGAYVCFYVIAYWFGTKLKDGFQFKNKYFILYVLIILCAFAIRFGGRILWDNTRFYNCIIVGYTQYIAAGSMLAVFAVIFPQNNGNKLLKWICKISFEIYLYHYMFIVGPVSLMNINGNWIISSLIVVGVTIVVAMCMHFITNYIEKYILKFK